MRNPQQNIVLDTRKCRLCVDPFAIDGDIAWAFETEFGQKGINLFVAKPRLKFPPNLIDESELL